LTRVIGIVSGKGGVGKTTVAVNLSIALSRFEKKILVIDCNISTPHVAYYLGAETYSITLSNIFKGEVDVKFAPSSHKGIMFIPASEELKDMDIDFEKLNTYVTKLAKKNTFDFIFLDSAPGLGDEAVSVLKTAEEILFVTTPTVPNINDMVRCAEFLSKLEHKDMKIVFNKVRKSETEMKMKDAKDFFRVPILGAIPFSEDVMDSTALGMPIFQYKPDSVICDHFMKIAANLIGIEYDNPSSLKKFFRKFKRGK
jgi:septum site-determining protein MinD